MAAIFCQESVVRGHHIYKSVWTPFVGEILDTKREAGNNHDRHAVAVVRDSCVVGHLPRQYSRVAWYFLQHGGKISCEITGRRRRDDTPGLGLVVPCLYKFEGKEKLVVRLREVVDKGRLGRSTPGQNRIFSKPST